MPEFSGFFFSNSREFMRNPLLLKVVNDLTFSFESNLWSGFVAPTGQSVGESLLQQ